MEKKYWPFKVLPPEQRTPLHAKQIQFLEDASRFGYHPYMDGHDFTATNADKRSGSIIKRGSRNRWEIVLSEANQKALSAFVSDFSCASAAILKWLSGGKARVIIAGCKSYLVVPPGAKSSHVIYMHS